jgi:hypothetical protein
MGRRRILLPAVAVTAAAAVVGVLVGAVTGSESSRDGTAILRNDTGLAPLEVVVRNVDGELIGEGTFEEVFVFDTEFPDRERQCLVAGDGGFVVRAGDGTVLAEHRFSDRAVCSLDELTLRDDGSLTWE